MNLKLGCQYALLESLVASLDKDLIPSVSHSLDFQQPGFGFLSIKSVHELSEYGCRHEYFQ